LSARILVVDDDPLSGELICEILRSAGHDASFLTSSAIAAERLHGNIMPSSGHAHAAPDGAELARSRASRVKRLTVIVMIPVSKIARLWRAPLKLALSSSSSNQLSAINYVK